MSEANLPDLVVVSKGELTFVGILDAVEGSACVLHQARLVNCNFLDAATGELKRDDLSPEIDRIALHNIDAIIEPCDRVSKEIMGLCEDKLENPGGEDE